MRKQLFDKRAGKTIGKTLLTFTCLFMMLLLGACVNLNEKRMSQLADNTGGHDGQKVVCRKIPVSGSRIGKKVCATEKQWAWHEEEKRRNAEAYLRDANDASRHDTTYPIPIETPPEGLDALMPRPQ